MQNPCLLEVDAGGNEEEVQVLALTVLQQNNINISP